MTVRRWPGGLVALAVSAAASACATLPTSGSISVNSLHGSGGTGQTGVQIQPVPPRAGWLPTSIVKGFLAASASPSYNATSVRPAYTVAREYLTPGYNKQWRPGWAATIIDSPKVTELKLPKSLVTHGPLGPVVGVTGHHLATLQTTGRYQAGSVVVEPASTEFDFSLTRVSGQWRISGITLGTKPDPTLLLIRRSDFVRDYQPRNLYFYAPGENSDVLVPDPVYIPQQAGSTGIVAGLVGALLKPPPNPSWLNEAATTAFPRGTVELGNPQVIGGLAVVDLGGAAAKAPAIQRRRMVAQLDLSLIPQSYQSQAENPIQSVVLKLNGRKVRPLSQGAYQRYLPSGLGNPLYYQVPAGQTGPAVVMRTSPARQVSVPMPKAVGGVPFSTIAVSTAPVGSAVVAGCSGKAVYLLPESHAGEVITTRLPADCTSLSWDAHGNLWVATAQQIFKIPGAGARPPARPALLLVQVPKFPHGKFVALRVAPDGVRVALIVRVGSATRIEVAAISVYADITYLAQNRQMLRVGPDVAHPIALSWLEPDHLLVLDQKDPARTVLYEVPLDGATSTEIPTPSGVRSVAVGPQSDHQPGVLVAIAPTATSPGEIEMSTTELTNPDWRPLVKGITPAFPG
jgi:lipoprotein LpqB-like beta-propeller protein/sporulation and spore germination protein